MTAQELYEIVRKEIDVRAFYDPNYRAIQKKIDEQKADFNDTARLSRLLSQILGEKLAKHILELPPDEGRSELCQQLLKDFFDEINHKLAQVQSSLDKKNGISLNPVQPSFPTERVQNVAGSLNDTTEPDSTIQRRCRNAVSNVANAMHDSFIQVNAKFRNNAGLFVQVTRTGGAECCDWCAQVSGTFWGYNRDLREVFRRHDNCTCTITYSSSKTRSRLVGESDGAGGTTHKWVESRKSWQEKPILPDVRPTRFTPEQAKHFETEQLQKQGLVRDGNGVKWVGRDKALDLAPESSTFQEMPISMDELKKVAESAALEVEKSLETQLTNESEDVIMNMGRFVEYYGEEHTEAMKEYLSYAPELIQKLWNRFAQSLYSIDEYYMKTSHYDPLARGVRLNIEEAASGNDITTPYEVVFHEFAHQIDYLLNSGSTEKSFSEVYRDGILGKTIKKEVEKALKDFETTLISSGAYQSLSREELEILFCDRIKSEFPENELQSIASISDMFESCFKFVEKPFGAGHGLEYWKNNDNSKETFAEMFSATVSNPESLKLIEERFFPKSYKIFLEILEVVQNDKA